MDMNELTFHDATVEPQNYDRGLKAVDMPSSYSPNIGLSEDQLPDIKDWQVGEEYILVLKVKQTGSNLYGPEEFKKINANFDILEVAGMMDPDSEAAGEGD